MEELYVQHSGGAWWDQVNFIVHIRGQYDEQSVACEQVGVRRTDDSTVILCSLPFYVYGLALGDSLTISPQNYKVIGIKAKAGRQLFRIMFKCGPDQIIEIAKRLTEQFTAVFEWRSKEFCAFDVENNDIANRCIELLEEFEKKGLLEYETGTSNKYGPIFPS